MAWHKLPRVPKGMQDWPADAVGLPISKIMEMYASGFAGTKYDPEERAALFAGQQWPDGDAVCSQFGLAGSGQGKLSLPYIFAHRHYPTCWPCPPQETGSCVGHGGKNAGLVLLGVECELGTPDPDTGRVEGWPSVSPEAADNGVLAWENIYGDRGHGGQGASCGRLVRHVTNWGGYLLRQNYPELGIDLTSYKTRDAIRWGSSQTPDAVRQEGRKHQVRAATDCPNHEVVRDMIANGYPVWCCSGYGWSSKRDENGYSKRSGSWAHSWIIQAYDDRDVTKQKYGFPLALYNHDWGRWNSGGRRILGTDIDIPEGTMWIDARLLDNCDCTALSSLNGWPPQLLKSLGATNVRG